MRIALPMLLVFEAAACRTAGDAFVRDAGGDADTDADAGADSDTGTDTGTGTEYTGPIIPETCEQAAQTPTSVGCLFYAVDLDSHDGVEGTQQFGVTVSNVNLTDAAHVVIHKGIPSIGGWDLFTETDVEPMTLRTFELPDLHMNASGVMTKGSYRIASDVPVAAYQFNPVDGASSYLSEASMLLPATSLSSEHDVVGWKQTEGDGDMRAYFSVVATVDGTIVTVEPSVAPLAGDAVPGTGEPFSVEMDEGDVLEVETDGLGQSLTGSRIASDPEHPIAVFSGHECALIPEDVWGCDHLEEQLPGLRFWGTEFVAARMPVRSTAASSEAALWQIYASEDGTEVTLSASPGVTGIDWEQAVLDRGQSIELWVAGNEVQPGDFFVQADKPIAVMQYMTGAENPDCNSIGDPSMAYTPPAGQFLPRYVVVAPWTWIEDALIITRHAGVGVLLDGATVPSTSFVPVAASGYEVARVAVDDGAHTLESADPESGLAVVVVGWDQWDSYAYAGGLGMAAAGRNRN